MALAGVVRDVLVALPDTGGLPAQAPYNIVSGIEIALLALAVLAALPLGARLSGRAVQS